MKKSKILIITVIITILTAMISSTVFAYDPSNIQGCTSGAGANRVKTVGEKILGIVRVAGTVTAVVTLIILGIKYMTGSIEEKAEYKKTLTPYLIGAIFVLAATNITHWIYQASQGFF